MPTDIRSLITAPRAGPYVHGARAQHPLGVQVLDVVLRIRLRRARTTPESPPRGKRAVREVGAKVG